MKQDNIYKSIVLICKKELIMEKHYGIEKISDTEPYFTTSQEADIKDMIRDGIEIDDILSKIRKW